MDCALIIDLAGEQSWCHTRPSERHHSPEHRQLAAVVGRTVARSSDQGTARDERQFASINDAGRQCC